MNPYPPICNARHRRDPPGAEHVRKLPFWAVFFKELGFRVVLSPSPTARFMSWELKRSPASRNAIRQSWPMVHVEWLIRQNVPFIFYPCIPYERKEVEGAGNHYNCPIVTSYSENIKNNMEELRENRIRFLNPFMAFTSEAVLSKAAGRGL